MKNLYIDFDGVISDTIEVTYEMMNKQKIDRKNLDSVMLFYQNLDWEDLLNKTPLINDSMHKIAKIITENVFDVSILTHVVSKKESIAKIKFIRRFLKDVTIIVVPKEVAKTDMVCAKDSILIDDFTGNLEDWEEHGGIGIKFSKTKKISKYPIISDLEEVLNLELCK